MENLLSQRKYADLLEPFSKKDFSQWLFLHLSLAACTQGRAQVLNMNGPAAEVEGQDIGLFLFLSELKEVIEHGAGDMIKGRRVGFVELEPYLRFGATALT